jgi:hypothetical protein
MGAEVRVGHLLEAAAVGIAGVIHQNVQSAKRFEGLGDRSTGCFWIGDVEFDCPHPLAVPLLQILQAFDTAAGGRHSVSTVESRDGEIGAEAARRSCYEPGLGRRHF